jgi:hypothetical protein
VREVFGDVGENISVPDYAKVRTADTTADAGGVPSGSLIGPKSSAGSMAGGQVTRPGRYGLVLVYLNGSFIHPEEAVNTVLSLPLSQVESMIYVSGVSAAAFQPSFDSGDVNPYPVLMVRTKPHVKTNKIPYNVSCDYPLGWQKPVKFYAPKYNSAEARRTAARDNRITLYWNPSVKVDANGEAWLRASANKTYLNTPRLAKVRGKIKEMQNGADKVAEKGENSGKYEPLPKLFAPEELYDDGYGVDRTIQLQTNTSSVALRTSTQNAISFLPLPSGVCTYTGMLTYYDSWQIQLRSVEDFEK